MKKQKFSPEGYSFCFALAKAVYATRFTSQRWKRNAALLMYMCEDALGSPQPIPQKCKERFPRESFSTELGTAAKRPSESPNG